MNRSRRVVFAWSAWSAASIAGPAPAGAQASPEKLGTITFPNSGNAAAQAPFLRGMKLYWNFEYEQAADAFRQAQRADPSFALAYAGEALTHTHQVWNEQDMAAARTALAKLGPTLEARRAKVKTEHEKSYLELAEVLYGDGAKARRDTLFNAVAERIEAAHPHDDEAKMFHALGLLGLNQGVREFTSYMKAGALAEDVLRRNPDHPAAAHFVIHAFDDPVHAPLGLWAARAYSKIAPAAPHAQHMTSHIFVAMGMWDDVISQNIIAANGQSPLWQAGHYTWWLGYGYGQAGQYAKARAHLNLLRSNFGKAARRGEASALVMIRAHYLVDTERWTDDVASWKLAVPPGAPASLAADSFAVAYARLKRGDLDGAARINDFVAKLAESGPDAVRPSAQVLDREFRAAIHSAAGKHAEAVALARDAAALEEKMPFEFGPPQFAKPPAELLGEILLAAGKPSEAQAAFTASLARTPGRSRSLVGLARAAHAAGDDATAASAVATLRANWHAADATLPELAELARLAATKD